MELNLHLTRHRDQLRASDASTGRGRFNLTQQSAEERTLYRAEIWLNVLREAGVDRGATVLELCPGESSKIGRALRMYGFRGTIYLLEPSRTLGPHILSAYSKVLPEAKVELIPLKLGHFVKQMRIETHAVLSNHPIDDLILGQVVPEAEWDAVWGGMYSDPNRSLTLVRSWWRFLEEHPELLDQAKSRVKSELLDLHARLSPELFALYQYRSTTARNAGFEIADQQSLHLLSLFPPSNNARISGSMLRMNLPPFEWLIWTREKARENDVPAAIERLGSQSFVTEIAQANPAPTIIAVDNECTPTVQDDLLTLAAGCKLLQNGSPARPVNVYVDRQHDPSGIALGPNLGSGRAAYITRDLNVKGLGRTSLARADKDSLHGNGRLNLMKGAWEMLVANTVSRAFWAGGSSVVALAGIGDAFKLKGATWTSVNSVRDDRGALDRPTHYLLPHARRLRPEELLQMASDFGRLDAEQYAERILHNAWSASNISLSGQLIDFDTASAVNGRCAHYSYNAKYPAVLFGNEGDGKKMVLQLLSKHLGHAIEPDLFAAFDVSRSQWLERRMLHLLGLDGEEILRTHEAFPELVTRISALFDTYGRKMYPDFAALDLRSNKASPAVFDFSRLFRNLPLHFAYETSTSRLNDTALTLLSADRPPASDAPSKLSETCKARITHRDLVVNSMHIGKCRKAAEEVASLLLELLCAVESLSLSSSALQRGLRAYRANENRTYLCIGRMLPILEEYDRGVQSGFVSPAAFQRFMQSALEANDRRTHTAELSVDTILYRDATFFRSISRHGDVCDRLHLFRELDDKLDCPSRLSLRCESRATCLSRMPDGSFSSVPYSAADLLSNDLRGARMIEECTLRPY